MTRPDGDLLRVEGLRITFSLQSGPLEAVKGASFRIRPGSVVALVGESGSGKSIIAQAILGILPPGVAKVTGGSINFPGRRAVATSPSTSPHSMSTVRTCRRFAAAASR